MLEKFQVTVSRTVKYPSYKTMGAGNGGGGKNETQGWEGGPGHGGPGAAPSRAREFAAARRSGDHVPALSGPRRPGFSGTA